jgi:hypothetical protein
MAEISEWVVIRWNDNVSPAQAHAVLARVPGVLPTQVPLEPLLPPRVPVVRSMVERVCSILRARPEVLEVKHER